MRVATQSSNCFQDLGRSTQAVIKDFFSNVFEADARELSGTARIMKDVAKTLYAVGVGAAAISAIESARAPADLRFMAVLLTAYELSKISNNLTRLAGQPRLMRDLAVGARSLTNNSGSTTQTRIGMLTNDTLITGRVLSFIYDMSKDSSEEGS